MLDFRPVEDDRTNTPYGPVWFHIEPAFDVDGVRATVFINDAWVMYPDMGRWDFPDTDDDVSRFHRPEVIGVVDTVAEARDLCEAHAKTLTPEQQHALAQPVMA